MKKRGIRPRAIGNRHLCWKLLDRQTLDQRLQLLSGLVDG